MCVLLAESMRKSASITDFSQRYIWSCDEDGGTRKGHKYPPPRIHIYKVHTHSHIYITYKIHNSQNNIAKGNTKRTQLDVKKVTNKAKSLSEWEREWKKDENQETRRKRVSERESEKESGEGSCSKWVCGWRRAAWNGKKSRTTHHRNSYSNYVKFCKNFQQWRNIIKSSPFAIAVSISIILLYMLTYTHMHNSSSSTYYTPCVHCWNINVPMPAEKKRNLFTKTSLDFESLSMLSVQLQHPSYSNERWIDKW